MPRGIRSIIPGGFGHITGNVVRGQYLFKPTPKFNVAVAGLLRFLQKRYGMVIYAKVFTSNHYHLAVSPKSQTSLSNFMRDLNSGLARLVQRLYRLTGTIFASRYRQSECCDDAQILHDYTYMLANTVTEGLVEDPRSWPGLHSASELCGGEPIVGVYYDNEGYRAAYRKDRTVVAKDFVLRESVVLTPIPPHAGMTRPQRERANRRIVQKIVREQAAERTRPVKGVAAVLAQDPLYVPRTVKVSKIDRFKAMGPNRKALIRLAKEAHKATVLAVDTAFALFLSGRRDVTFPDSGFIPLVVRKDDDDDP